MVFARHRKPIIIYYGQEGSFTEEAALKYFEAIDAQFIPSSKFLENVFSAVVKGEADYGVVPVENSDAGIVNQTYDLLLEEKAYVIGEIILRINQCLLVNKGITIDKIRRVYSHPTALLQCSKFLQKHGWDIIAEADTASCAKKLKSESIMDAGVIAGKRASIVYDLEILEEGIQNDINNFTRFFIISGKKFEGYANKTSIIIGIRGSLNEIYDYLESFVKRNILIQKIESRPSKSRPFEYILYIDFLGDPNETRVKDAMNELLHKSQFVKLIGTYKAAEFPFNF
jgi:prephenate dehydratase